MIFLDYRLIFVLNLVFNLHIIQEIKLIFPGSQRLNRGNYEVNQLMEACRANNVTDFIILNENRGKVAFLLRYTFYWESIQALIFVLF